jgi:short-chain Z-isoprenyl diphosphate synthase
MDGNRRWARQVGLTDPILGHRHGAAHVSNLLGWCETAGIRHLTLFVCSTENLQRRDDHEISHLMRLIDEVVAERLAGGDHPWRLHLSGRLDLLPPSTAHALTHARDVTSDREGHHLTLAIGYGGRAQRWLAVRSR